MSISKIVITQSLSHHLTHARHIWGRKCCYCKQDLPSCRNTEDSSCHEIRSEILKALNGGVISLSRVCRSEIPSDKCAKLRTMAASNNRDHASQSLLLLVARATYIMVLFFTHIPFVVNHTINATPPERLQQCQVAWCSGRSR